MFGWMLKSQDTVACFIFGFATCILYMWQTRKDPQVGHPEMMGKTWRNHPYPQVPTYDILTINRILRLLVTRVIFPKVKLAARLYEKNRL